MVQTGTNVRKRNDLSASRLDYSSAQWPRQVLGWAVVATIFSLFLSGRSLGSEEPAVTESQVQVAYLYNFGKFIKWPPIATAKTGFFNICVYGQDPFGPFLNTTVAGEIIAGKAVVARRILDAREAVNCQILFISSSEGSRLKRILEILDKEPVLTVSDMPQFLHRGGIIQFVSQSNRIRFAVDLSAAQNVGLNLSSELLKVAAEVKGNQSPGG